MDNKYIALYADMLYDSENSRVSVDALTDLNDSLTIDDAYSIQLYNVERALNRGEVISGKKIGLTSVSIQKQLGVNEPDYGHLFKSMDIPSGRIPTDELIVPKIEPEIAFVLKHDLSGGNVTEQDVIDATDYIVAAFEIVDSRVRDWKIKLIDTVSDNASSGRYVLSKHKFKLCDIDIKNISVVVYKNGEQLLTGNSSAVLGNPLTSVAWLSNKLYNYGVILKKGEIVLSGAFTSAPEAKKGDVFSASFSDIGDVYAEFV